MRLIVSRGDRNEAHLIDVSAANAYFLTWIYLTDDRSRKERMLSTLHGDLQYVDDGRISYWFPISLIGPHQSQDFIATFRRDVLTRQCSNGMKIRLLDIFYRIGEQPELKEHLLQASISLQTPVFWIMRALQRQLCVHEEEKWDREMVMTAFDSMT